LNLFGLFGCTFLGDGTPGFLKIQFGSEIRPEGSAQQTNGHHQVENEDCSFEQDRATGEGDRTCASRKYEKI
jgi:hypothetical protein